VSSTPVVQKVTSTTKNATLSVTSSVRKLISTIKSAGVTLTSELFRVSDIIYLTLSASVSASASLTKSIAKTISATFRNLANLSRAGTYTLILEASIHTTGVLRKFVAVTKSTIAKSVASINKRIDKTAEVLLSLSAEQIRLKVINLILSATIVPAASLVSKLKGFAAGAFIGVTTTLTNFWYNDVLKVHRQITKTNTGVAIVNIDVPVTVDTDPIEFDCVVDNTKLD
jgi:hypothetical protein